MYDDRVQGILFNQTQYVDLRFQSRGQRLLQRLQATGRLVRDHRMQDLTQTTLNPFAARKQRRAEKATEQRRLALVGRIKVNRRDDDDDLIETELAD